MNLNQDMIRVLENEGCHIVGFADVRILPEESRKGCGCGIIMGAPYTAEGMRENLDGNSQRFADDSGSTFEPLVRFKDTAVHFLKEKGYKANTTYRNTIITHKTIGTLSGIGWIGRCALLTTKEYGPALRLTAVLTNAPFECGTPVTKSLCPPNCSACADICPTSAIKEGLWERGVHRDEFFDVEACKKGRRIRKPMCGLCISVCPYTKEGLGYE